MFNEIISLVSTVNMHNPNNFMLVCGIIGALSIATYYRVCSI